MTKLEISSRWLKEVEAVEEELEAMKLDVWRLSKNMRPSPSNVVRSTAGLLEGRVPPGRVYERRLRSGWERESRQRLS